MQSSTQARPSFAGIGAIVSSAAAALRRKVQVRLKRSLGRDPEPPTFLPGQRINPAANARRKMKKLVGARQFRRDRCRSYALRGEW